MEHRGQSKIGRLPYQLRHEVNLRIRDGMPYVRIIAWLKEQGCEEVFSEQNFTNWYQSANGYGKWEREQARLIEMQSRREFAERLVKDNDGTKVHEAALQIATSQIYEVLSEYNLDNLHTLLEVEPENYSKLVNGLARLSKGALDIQKYQEQVAERKRAIEAALKTRDDKGGLAPETIERIERELKLL
jgi:hypothetical protein